MINDVINVRIRWGLASSCSDPIANQANIILDERASNPSRVFSKGDHTVLNKAYAFQDKHTKVLLKLMFESEFQIRQRISVDDVTVEFRRPVFSACGRILNISPTETPESLEVSVLAALTQRKAPAGRVADLPSPVLEKL